MRGNQEQPSFFLCSSLVERAVASLTVPFRCTLVMACRLERQEMEMRLSKASGSCATSLCVRSNRPSNRAFHLSHIIACALIGPRARGTAGTSGVSGKSCAP